jgi:hypothetical protein
MGLLLLGEVIEQRPGLGPRQGIGRGGPADPGVGREEAVRGLQPGGIEETPLAAETRLAAKGPLGLVDGVFADEQPSDVGQRAVQSPHLHGPPALEVRQAPLQVRERWRVQAAAEHRVPKFPQGAGDRLEPCGLVAFEAPVRQIPAVHGQVQEQLHPLARAAFLQQQSRVAAQEELQAGRRVIDGLERQVSHFEALGILEPGLLPMGPLGKETDGIPAAVEDRMKGLRSRLRGEPHEDLQILPGKIRRGRSLNRREIVFPGVARNGRPVQRKTPGRPRLQLSEQHVGAILEDRPLAVGRASDADNPRTGRCKQSERQEGEDLPGGRRPWGAIHRLEHNPSEKEKAPVSPPGLFRVERLD